MKQRLLNVSLKKISPYFMYKVNIENRIPFLGVLVDFNKHTFKTFIYKISTNSD